MSADQPANLRPFFSALRKVGFELEWDSRAGGVRTIQWLRQENERRIIIVQLWGDGRHRVTHSIGRRETTIPTDFIDVAQMVEAIEVERSRTDNLALMEANHAAE